MDSIFLIKGEDYGDQGGEWVTKAYPSGYTMRHSIIREAATWKTHKGAQRIAEDTGGQVIEMTQEQLSDVIAKEKAKLLLHEFLQEKAILFRHKAHEREAWRFLWESCELMSEFVPGTEVRVYPGTSLEFHVSSVDRIGEYSFWVEDQEYSLLDGRRLNPDPDKELSYALPNYFGSSQIMKDWLILLFHQNSREFIFEEGQLMAIAQILSAARKRYLGT